MVGRHCILAAKPEQRSCALQFMACRLLRLPAALPCAFLRTPHRTHLQDLKDVTNEVLYENYRKDAVRYK